MSEKIVVDINSPKVKQIMDTDERLKTLMNHIGNLEVPLRTNLYESIIRSINGQLLSAKVADIIHGRLVNLLQSNITPETVMSVSDEELREIGISKRKVSYMRDLTERVLSKEIILENFYYQTDDEVVQTLTSIKGIGQWTAEMFLIFSLGRENVLAFKDVGLQRGAKWLYQLESNEEGLEYMQEKSDIWQPYRTIPSLYLWEIVTRDYIYNYEDVYELVGK